MVPRIRQIQIQNFKSIERAVVDLEPFTAFVGTNGTGKSNFVSALAFVRDCLSQPIEEVFRSHGGLGAFPRWHSLTELPPVGIRLQIDLAENRTADYAFSICWDSQIGYRVLREKCEVRSNSRVEALFEISDGEFVHEIPGIRPQVAPDRLALLAVSATEEFRPAYNFLTSMRVYSIDPVRVAISRELTSGEVLASDGGNAAAVLKALEERDPEAHSRIGEYLSLISEGVQGVEALLDGRQLRLMFKKDLGLPGPEMFHGFEMSEGTLRVLGLLLAVYQPRHPSVLVIEEPEVTVHPAAAEVIMEILLGAARHRQVLITTHSPDLLDGKELSDQQIRVVTSEQGRTVIATLANASRQAVRERLYTPGELLRIDELNQDLEAARIAAQQFDLFGEFTPHPVP